MPDSVLRELRILKLYALVLTLAVSALSLMAFTQSRQRTKFDEIDVERINIVEPNGNLRMVISNAPRSIGPIYRGKPFGYPGGGRPGIVFFNDEGTENGGLTFTGKRDADGKYHASSGLSFDQYNQDQVLYFQYSDNNGQRRVGFTIADRAALDIHDLVAERDAIMKMPEGVARTEALRVWALPRNGVPLFAPRVYIGRDPVRSAVINLSDPNGKPRLRLMVDSLGAASVEFLDETGRVTSRLPDTRRQ
ncbi:MAG TPA: hypothetical protein VHE82_09135 [Gemmatimonadaceae bacterium]|nr:hypothetical protein [Gemmatimonadaceae bacterium]